MRISTRLVLLIGVLSAFAVAATLYLVSSVFDVHGQHKKMFETSTAAALAADRADTELKTEVQEWKNTLIRGADPAQRAKYYAAIGEQASKVKEAIDELRRLLPDRNDEIADNLKEFDVTHTAMTNGYQAAFPQYEKILASDGHQAAIAAADLQVKGIDRRPSELAKEISDSLRERVQKQSTALGNSVPWSVGLAISVLALGLVGVFVVATLLGRGISVPIRQLADVSRRVASGKIADEGEAKVEGSGELGTLADSFREVEDYVRHTANAASSISRGDLGVELRVRSEHDVLGLSFRRMQQYIAGIAAGAEQLSKGDLTMRVMPQSEADQLSHNVNHAVEALQQMMKQVQIAGITVTSSSTEIAAGSREQEASVAELAATAKEIAATTTEISATANELMQTMGDVSNVTSSTARSAAQSKLGLESMERTMGQMVESAANITTRLSVLSEKASNISSVVTTIMKVADQTNLLSLNAAIEAEKAGEFGLGFAVVANEVRRLADQTAMASTDIELMVKEMQSAVSAAVMGMDGFAGDNRHGSNDVRQVATQHGSINEAVQELVPRFENVKEGMAAQVSGAAQIAEGVNMVVESSEQSSEALRQNRIAVEQLNEAAEELQMSVGRFRISENGSDNYRNEMDAARRRAHEAGRQAVQQYSTAPATQGRNAALEKIAAARQQAARPVAAQHTQPTHTHVPQPTPQQLAAQQAQARAQQAAQQQQQAHAQQQAQRAQQQQQQQVRPQAPVQPSNGHPPVTPSGRLPQNRPDQLPGDAGRE
ncbi:MAG: methyl-accepting chemotaxis protein [Planctomycetota bacterium]